MGLGQSVAPFWTAEASTVGFAMTLVFAAIDARAGSTSTHTGRRLAWALLLVCASESAFAAFQWSTDRRALFGRKSDFQTMPFGSYVNHNNFAGLVSLGVPLAVAMAIGDLRRSGKLTAKGLGLLGLAAGLSISTLASGSRGGAVALLLGLVVLTIISSKLLGRGASRRSYLVPAAISLGIGALVLGALPAKTRTRLSDLFGHDGSASYRVEMGRTAVRAFSHRPLLGSGLGAFADAAAPYKQGHGDVRSERAEADLIEFAVEGGGVLMAGLALFMRFAWKAARLEMVHGRDRSGRWLRAGAVSACATMMFHSFFDFGFRIPANALAFAVLLGIATAAGSDTAGAARAATGALKPRAFLAFVAIVVAACGYRSVGAARERDALSRRSAESRLDALQSLVDAHPYLDGARRQRGLAWMALAYNRGLYDPIRLKRARADLEAVVRARPKWGEARADLGWIKYYSGETLEAKIEMGKAAQCDPTHLGLGIAHAQLLAWSGDILGAVDEVSRLRRVNPPWTRASAQDLASSWTQNSSLLSKIP